MKNHWLDNKKKLQFWELCYQFDNDETIVIGTVKEGEEASLLLTAIPNSNMIFRDIKTGKQFKLLMREKQLKK